MASLQRYLVLGYSDAYYLHVESHSKLSSQPYGDILKAGFLSSQVSAQGWIEMGQADRHREEYQGSLVGSPRQEADLSIAVFVHISLTRPLSTSLKHYTLKCSLNISVAVVSPSSGLLSKPGRLISRTQVPLHEPPSWAHITQRPKKIMFVQFIPSPKVCFQFSRSRGINCINCGPNDVAKLIQHGCLDAKKPFFGDTSFFQFNKILSGSCAAFTCLVILAFAVMHMTHYSKPNEQSKYVYFNWADRLSRFKHQLTTHQRILKICLLLPFYAVICFLSVVFPIAFVYLSPWLEFVQSISLGAFFLLMCQFVSPSNAQQDVFFATLIIEDKKSPTGQADGLAWFRVCHTPYLDSSSPALRARRYTNKPS